VAFFLLGKLALDGRTLAAAIRIGTPHHLRIDTVLLDHDAGAAPHLTATDSQMPASCHLPPVALHATIKHQPLDRDVPVAIE